MLESDITFFTLFNESLDAIVLLDIDTQKFVKFNQKALNLYGYSEIEFKNITPKELTAEFFTDAQMREKQKYILEKGWDKFTTKHKRKDGKLIDVFVKSKRVKFNNKFLLYITLHDLTKERELEFLLHQKTEEQKSLLTLFDKGNVSLLKWNNDEFLRVEYASENVYSLFGYRKEELMENNFSYINLIHKLDLDRVKSELFNAIETKEHYFAHKPYRIVTKHNEIKWLLVHIVIIRDRDNNISHFLGNLVDITDLKEYETNLEKIVKIKTQENLEQFKILQQQSKLVAMGEMINSIAHQWRQPLAISNTIVAILKEKNRLTSLDKNYLNKKLDELEKNNLYMSQTIEDFLSFFSPKKSKEKFNILSTVKESIYILKNNLNEKKIEVYLDIDKNIFIYSYKKEYLQVILSLLTNSIQAFKNNKLNREIVIKANKIENSLFLDIIDNAGGIDEQIIDRIFEPYFTTKHQTKGTGLGLYISKTIVEESMQGELKVVNIKNGIKFTIFIKDIGI